MFLLIVVIEINLELFEIFFRNTTALLLENVFSEE